jgi:hypothetical protein
MSGENGLGRFYQLMDALCNRLGGYLYLRDCTGRYNWPSRGVYYFCDEREPRTGSGKGYRVVRVGTHALTAGSSTSLWQRLSQHAGSKSSGAGNHRGSIFRLLVGEAIQRRDRTSEPRTWGVGSDPGRAGAKLSLSAVQVRESERVLEAAVSRYIAALPFLVVAAEDAPGPESVRGLLERNSIALLSNIGKERPDSPTPEWLGRHSGRQRVKESGLWNNRHVEEAYDPPFLEVLQKQIAATKAVRSG